MEVLNVGAESKVQTPIFDSGSGGSRSLYSILNTMSRDAIELKQSYDSEYNEKLLAVRDELDSNYKEKQTLIAENKAKTIMNAVLGGIISAVVSVGGFLGAGKVLSSSATEAAKSLKSSFITGGSQMLGGVVEQSLGAVSAAGASETANETAKLDTQHQLNIKQFERTQQARDGVSQTVSARIADIQSFNQGTRNSLEAIVRT